MGLYFLQYVCCILFSLSVFDFLVGSIFLKHAILEKCISAQPRGGARALFQKQSQVSNKTFFLERTLFSKQGVVSQKGFVFQKGPCFLEKKLVFRNCIGFQDTNVFVSRRIIFSRKGLVLLKRHCFQEKTLVSGKQIAIYKK